jgi:hypothetical protein
MGDLCSNIDTFLALHAILTTQLENPVLPPSSPEAAAIKRLKESGIPLVPLKRRKGETNSNKKPKKDAVKVHLYLLPTSKLTFSRMTHPPRRPKPIWTRLPTTASRLSSRTSCLLR